MFSKAMKSLLPFLAVTVLMPLGTAHAATQPSVWPCGDLNGDGMIHVGDALDLTHYMVDLFEPMPDSFQNADMDGKPGVTPGDLAYLLEYLFCGGSVPCGTGVNDPIYGGSVQLIGVQGLIDQNTVASGRQLKFTFQCSNTLDQGIWTMTNGFAVTSPDNVSLGACLDFIGRIVDDSIYVFSAAPESADNLGFFLFDVVAWEGRQIILDSMASDVYFVITVDPISVDDVGKTIVIDSSSFGHLGYWEWSLDGLSPVIPAWGGPYTFTVGSQDI